MSAGQTVVIKFGPHRGKRAEVIAVNGSKVLVRGSFGPATYQIAELEAIS